MAADGMCAMTEKTPDDRTTDTAGTEQPVSTGPVEKDGAADIPAAAGLAAAGLTAADPLVPTVVAPPADYSAAGVPSLDFVRDKIEGRYGRSLGSTELAQETQEARAFEEQAAKREEAARDKLAEIRRSLRGDKPS